MNASDSQQLGHLPQALDGELRIQPLQGVPLVQAGDDLLGIVLSALRASSAKLQDGDVLVIAQKIISKCEGRIVDLATVSPSARALELAEMTGKDARLVELILCESNAVLRHRRDVLIVEHRLGFVMANAGIDQSNVEHPAGVERALLLPKDPDHSCATLRRRLRDTTGADVAVIINDSHGRPWRNGTVGVAIGSSGLAALLDLRGKPDLYGRALRITQVGHADELAAAASLAMGQAEEGRAIVLIRGVVVPRRDGNAQELIRPKEIDLFRAPQIGGGAVDLLHQRRSIRRYLAKPVPQTLLSQLLAAAVCAPSAHNRQPWRFKVLSAAAEKEQLARAMGNRLRADRLQDGDSIAAIEADVSRSHGRLTQSPAVIVVSLTLENMDAYPDEKRTRAEYLMAVQSCAMAVQNLLLAAHAQGLGACWMCAPLFCPDVVAQALALPDAWQPQAIVTLGYPADQGKPYSRRPLSQVAIMGGKEP